MDYSFDSETRMLAESVARFVADHAGTPDDLWPLMAELGWLGLPFREEAGGLGLGTVGTMVLMEGFGAGLLAEPFIPSVVMAGSVLAHSPRRADRLPPLMEGRSRLAAACLREPDTLKARARIEGGNHRLNGTGILALGAGEADAAIVPAHMEGTPEIGFFLVPFDSPGVERAPQALADGRQALHLNLTEVILPSAHRLNNDDGHAVFSATRDAALLGVAAENLGAMQSLFDMTLDYAKTRKQFGRAIGSFQAIQFRLVDLWIKLDEARSLVMTAAMAADENHADTSRLAAAAWVQTLWSGKAICEEAIQIHGAIGMTEEYAAGRYVKRILVNELVFGPAERHLARCRSRPAT